MVDLFKTEGGEVTLGAETRENGIIVLSLAGDMSARFNTLYQEWADNVYEKIKQRAALYPASVFVLIDLTKLDRYDPKSSEVIYDLMKLNKGLVTRSAVFGANELVQIAVNTLTTILHRDNMKVFETEPEAVAWLSS
jgi:hypothetical protein